jgi:hypothetical protein
MKVTGFLLVFSVIVLLLTSCGGSESKKYDTGVVKNPASAQPGKQQSSQPEIRFERTEHDFGRLVDGEKVSYSYKFTNTGGADLIITQAKGSCGCTVPRFPTIPMKPGESGFIEVTFDSSNRPGFQNKTITVVANTVPSTVVLTVKANVVKL